MIYACLLKLDDGEAHTNTQILRSFKPGNLLSFPSPPDKQDIVNANVGFALLQYF
jgi:hypothetical protein